MVTTINSLRKDVDELKVKLKFEDKHFIIGLGFSQLDEPHGFLHGSLFHIKIKHRKEHKWKEAVDTETELKSNREYYDNLMVASQNKFMKVPDHPFHSWESFIEYNRCKCGKHGLDGKQPYYGDNQNGESQQILD